jgi:hypothetical protein
MMDMNRHIRSKQQQPGLHECVMLTGHVDAASLKKKRAVSRSEPS